LLCLNRSYVKLHLSEGGKNTADTKKKTKAHRPKKGAKGNPVWKFVDKYRLKNSTDPSYRLQIALWNHHALAGNAAVGGLSIGIQQLRSEPGQMIAGWFHLLAEAAGRQTFLFGGDAADPAPKSTLTKSRSEESILSAVSAVSTGTVAQSAIMSMDDAHGTVELGFECVDNAFHRDQLVAQFNFSHGPTLLFVGFSQVNLAASSFLHYVFLPPAPPPLPLFPR
jgi:hypothetical protein